MNENSDPTWHLKDLIIESSICRDEITFKRDDYLEAGHKQNERLFFIKSGSVRVFNSNDGIEHCLYFGFRNSLISSLDSFLGAKKSNLKIQAIKKTEVSVIKKNDFFELINRSEYNKKLWESTLRKLLLNSLNREINLLTQAPLKRYKYLLKNSPNLFQEIPHKYLASYLRMSPETLSRLQKS